ncbi:MAG: hypothetical protein D6695_01495 [Planctomycetota bacterium]|nr:MAG: hypothetical protein D6695_01495 [Planctomycetota bacterium]
MSGGSSDNPSGHSARCVIWRAPDAAVPRDLAAALHRRQVWSVECESATWAVAELCRMHTSDAETPVILLLVNPKALVGAEEVVAVASRYAPHASAWVYEEENDPPLRALSQLSDENEEQCEQSDSMDMSAGLRLIDDSAPEGESEPDNQPSGCETGQTSPSVLSRDELASLKRPEQVRDPEA